MRQPCKTRPFSFATLVCPYCQDRFVLLRLCWFLSVWPVSYLLLKLLTETSLFDIVLITLSPNFVPSYYFRLVCKNFNDLRAPVTLQDLRPVVPESECKITPFPRHGKIFRNIFSDYFHTLRLNCPQISPLHLKNFFQQKRAKPISGVAL